MNILFVTLFSLKLNSSVSISSRSIIKGLISMGHQVTVIMPGDNNASIIEDLSLSKIIRISGEMKSLSKYYIVNKIHSKLEIWDFRCHRYLKEARRLIIPEEYFDIVISVSDPMDSHLFTKRIINRGLKYGRWIQHWGDPLYGNISHKLLWPKFVIRAYEWFLLKPADKIVYVTPFSADDQKLLHKRISDKIQFVPLPSDGQIGGETPKSGMMKVAYVGDYNKYIRNILPLYNACAHQEGIKLTIAGSGVPLLPLDNITIYPRVPYEQAVKIENEADVIVAICNLRGTQIPGKIFYKSGTNKHILVALEEDRKEQMRSYFDSYYRFTTCENNAESILFTLNTLRSRANNFITPPRLLPESVALEIIQ